MKNKLQTAIKVVGVFALVLMVVLGMVLPLHAAPLTAFVAPYNTYTNILLSTPATVSQFVIANATGTNTYVVFFDNTGTNTLYTNSAYTTTSWTSGLITNIYTNYFGVLNTNIYTGLSSNQVSVAASTSNLFPIPFAATIPANTTVVFDGAYQFFSGIHVTNGLGQVTISGTYR